MSRTVVKITKRGKARVWSGHPWLFVDEIIEREKKPNGEIVRVEDENGKFIGQAFYSRNSKIALRFLSLEEKEIDSSFFEEKIINAVEIRKKITGNSEAYRLFFSEADGIPGLIIDNYKRYLVIQTLTAGTEKLLPVFVDILKSRLDPLAILSRNDVSVRELEGLSMGKKVFFGEMPERVEIKEGNIRYLVDLWNGHKTGAYLDQRENRLNAIAYSGKNVLDCFAYQGHFSLHLASIADAVVAIESSASAIEILKENLKLNGINNVESIKGNAIDILKDFSKKDRKFDLIILDPPPFAPSKKNVENARRGYKEINMRAFKLLNGGGHLITCCCSYNILEDEFMAILSEAAADSRRKVTVVEKRMQGRDHPVILNFPEGYYLKCIILRVN